MKKIIVAIIVILAVIIFLDFVIINQEFIIGNVLSDMSKEFIKFSLQLILIVIMGGVLINEYNRKRQREIDYKKFRSESHKSLVNAYLKTKQIRWSFRVECKNNLMDYKVYKNGLSKIIDLKTQIEIIIHEIRIYQKPFKIIESDLITNLEMMENYIKDLYEEYECKSPEFCQDDKSKINTQGLDKLNAFIAKRIKENVLYNESLAEEESPFTIHYRKYFYKSIDLLKTNKVQ